jgi:hypothetical protein
METVYRSDEMPKCRRDREVQKALGGLDIFADSTLQRGGAVACS